MTGQSWNVDAMHKVANLLRSWGWPVFEMDGWQTRGRPEYELRADYIVTHHTAAAVDIDRILRDGRSDLVGPLCNFALHLNGDVVLVAAGKANHAGVASISSQKSWGIEATGPVPVSAKGTSAFPNYRAYIALVVAIRVVEGWGVDRIRAHKEIALPDGRKPDPAFGSVYPKPYPDMDRFRAACSVDRVLRNPAPTPAPTPIPTPVPEDDMFEAPDRKLLTHVDDMLADNNVAGKVNQLATDMTALGKIVAGLDAKLDKALAALPTPPPAG